MCTNIERLDFFFHERNVGILGRTVFSYSGYLVLCILERLVSGFQSAMANSEVYGEVVTDSRLECV
jgi:hypothetical protein